MRYATGLPNLSQAATEVLLGQSLPAPVLVQDQVLALSTRIPLLCALAHYQAQLLFTAPLPTVPAL